MNPDTVASLKRPNGLPFRIGKIGHVGIYAQDLERSARFYTEVLGFQVTDVIAPGGELNGGAVFLRCSTDHHAIALFQATDENKAGGSLHHIAMEVPTIDELVRVREHLRLHQVQIDLDGRRGAGVQLVVEFRDPDGHRLEIYWNSRARPTDQWKSVNTLETAIADPVVGQDTTLHDPSLMKH
jgi:catechol 2,3-dioxygenase-like lactoylglutathione lyase family enzyme